MIVSAIAPKVSFGNADQKTIKSSPHAQYGTIGSVAMNSTKDATTANAGFFKTAVGAVAFFLAALSFTACDPTGAEDVKPNPDPPVETVGKISQADANVIGKVQMHIAATGTTALQDTMAVTDDVSGEKTAYKFEKIDEYGNVVYKRYDSSAGKFKGVTGKTIFYVENNIGKAKDYLFADKDTLLIRNPEFIDKITGTEKYMDRFENGVKRAKLTPLEEAGQLTKKVIEQSYTSSGKSTLINLYNKVLENSKYLKK